MWYVGFHVGKKQLHALPSTTFNSSCWWFDIVFIKDGIRILVDIVIADPTRANLLLQSYAIQGFATSGVAQTKERNCCNWHPIDQFLPLVIEVFGCLHKHVDVFLHDDANTIWSLKGIKGSHLFTLVTFFCQKVLITLQKMQASSILSWVVVVGLTTSWLSPLQDTPPITIVNLLQFVGFWHINMADLP